MSNPLIEKFYELNPTKKPEEEIKEKQEEEIKFPYDPNDCIHINSSYGSDLITLNSPSYVSTSSTAYNPYSTSPYTTYSSSLINSSLLDHSFKDDRDRKIHVAKQLSHLLYERIVDHILENNLIQKKRNVFTGEEEYTVKIKILDF